MTYLQLVNAVLKKLRKDQVTTVTETDYSTLIGEFVNETKQEVEDSWNWSVLRTILSVTTSASVDSYTITGSNDRTVIMRIINDTADTDVFKKNWSYINSLSYLGTSQNASPVYWAPDGQTSNELDIKVWPVPNAVETLRIFAKVPQDDLSNDSDELSIPDRVVILGAYARAVDERGEDGGTSLTKALHSYGQVWGDAIITDINNTVGELDWEVH